ncbi:MAG: type II toxin-antitoxin system VapC family toxin [Bacteroidota bacterium]
MILFLDTSSLFKLYHKEEGTEELVQFLRLQRIEKVMISELTLVEFNSTIWKKCRTKELNLPQARILMDAFNSDLQKYTVMPVSNEIIQRARFLMEKYWDAGLRTLDSIQLASVMAIEPAVDVFLTADHVLIEISKLEKIPNR